MNRRKMLMLTAGFALTGMISIPIKAQENLAWFISEEELNTPIINPNSPKKYKSVKTNRFDSSLSRYEKFIKKAESVYPAILPTYAVNGGKTLWYENEQKSPFNITSLAINYFFEQTLKVENANADYIISVETFEAITNKVTRNSNSVTYEASSNMVTEVSLELVYGYACGNLCGWGFNYKKRVYFDDQENIVALFMPNRIQWIS